MKKTTESKLIAWLASRNRPQLQIYLDSLGNVVVAQAGNPLKDASGRSLEEAVLKFLGKQEDL